MRTIITKVRVDFEGIYEWGTGFIDDHKYRLWHLYWSTKCKGIFWNVLSKQEYGQISHFIVSTYGGGYMHPDNFTIFVEGGVSPNGAIKELEELCQRCAEECGGKVQILVSTKTINFEEERLWV